jgi:hypothetical protein
MQMSLRLDGSICVSPQIPLAPVTTFKPLFTYQHSQECADEQLVGPEAAIVEIQVNELRSTNLSQNFVKDQTKIL